MMRFEDHDMWQGLIDSVEPNRPSVGKRVKVNEGEKHAGVEGRVTWHGVDKFYRGNRYHNDAQQLLHDAMGTSGFRIRIQPDDGEAFFIAADKVKIIPAADPGAVPK